MYIYALCKCHIYGICKGLDEGGNGQPSGRQNASEAVHGCRGSPQQQGHSLASMFIIRPTPVPHPRPNPVFSYQRASTTSWPLQKWVATKCELAPDPSHGSLFGVGLSRVLGFRFYTAWPQSPSTLAASHYVFDPRPPHVAMNLPRMR